ncbi:Tn3 family transposase, partial [Rhodococcus jostii]|uniref:Tn3 family transposase n=1 Tax=Rhodococcus jostii TaxID=132919 RepID=UPI00363957E9
IRSCNASNSAATRSTTTQPASTTCQASAVAVFVVPVRTHHARPNPKYFGRRRDITWLNMINDQAAGLAAKVLSGTPRDSLHTVDVVLAQHGGRMPGLITGATGL